MTTFGEFSRQLLQHGSDGQARPPTAACWSTNTTKESDSKDHSLFVNRIGSLAAAKKTTSATMLGKTQRRIFPDLTTRAIASNR